MNMNKNNFVAPLAPAARQNDIPTAYPDLVEPAWRQQQPAQNQYRTNSYTDPVKEAVGFVIKYSLWFVLSIVISIGLVMRWQLETGTGLIVWGAIATAGYIVIFFLLSVFTPEGVGVVNQIMLWVTEYYAFRRYQVYADVSLKIELRKLELRKEIASLSQQPQPQQLTAPTQASMALPAFAWRPDEDFNESIEDELSGQSEKQSKAVESVSILVDFVADLYDNAKELLRDDGQTINLQAGITLPWSKRSEIQPNIKAEIKSMIDEIEPPLFIELSGGRVWQLNTAQYPTKLDAIKAMSV